MLSAKVTWLNGDVDPDHRCAMVDSCLVENGGCGKHAICSHDAESNEVRCTCKTGYTNVGTDTTTDCTGRPGETCW